MSQVHFGKKWVSFENQPWLRLANVLTKPSLDYMAGCTLPLSLRFLSFTWGQTCITFRVLSTLPRPLLILSHAVMSLNKIFACLILSRHLLNNRWRTQTNTPSLVPKAQKLSLNSSVWPFVIWLLLTSLFSFPLLLFYAPSTLIYSHSFNVLWSLTIVLCTCNCFFQEYFFPHHQVILQVYASVVQGSLPDSPGLN